MPILRLPFHVSYLHYLAGFSPALARSYFAMALTLCRWTGVQPSLLLHPLDFLGVDDGIEPLKFFPGMSIPSAVKLDWLDSFIAAFRRRFEVVPMGAHVDALEATKTLPVIDPVFAATSRGRDAGGHLNQLPLVALSPADRIRPRLGLRVNTRRSSRLAAKALDRFPIAVHHSERSIFEEMAWPRKRFGIHRSCHRAFA